MDEQHEDDVSNNTTPSEPKTLSIPFQGLSDTPQPKTLSFIVRRVDDTPSQAVLDAAAADFRRQDHDLDARVGFLRMAGVDVPDIPQFTWDGEVTKEILDAFEEYLSARRTAIQAASEAQGNAMRGSAVQLRPVDPDM